jgi:hypothetical protein
MHHTPTSEKENMKLVTQDTDLLKKCKAAISLKRCIKPKGLLGSGPKLRREQKPTVVDAVMKKALKA